MTRVWMNGALNGVYALSVSMAMWCTPAPPKWPTERATVGTRFTSTGANLTALTAGEVWYLVSLLDLDQIEKQAR